MTENEAIERIKKDVCSNRCIPQLCNDGCMYGDTKCAFSVAIKALEELKQYRKVGTVEECQVAREKQTAMKMRLGDDNGRPRHCCNSCGCFVLPTATHCSKCGQKLNWEE